MPDITTLLVKRWKLILGLTLVATALALVISLVRPKEYLSTVTALPANSLTADKARIFNSDIESLYPEIGTTDELDRMEGTTKLDTIYAAVADSFDLASHYGIDKNSSNAVLKAAWSLKKNTDIRRSAYGELKIKVWDGSPILAAELANAIFEKLNAIHQHIQNANNSIVLNRLREEVQLKQRELDSLEAAVVQFKLSENDFYESGPLNDTPIKLKTISAVASKASVLNEQVKEYYRLISQYELSLKINSQVLIAVENARPSLAPDRPKILQTTLLAFAASFAFSFLLALFAESRKARV